MTTDRVDVLLQDLRAELAVAPAADFAARVRVRIAAAPSRSWRLGGWKVVMAGAMLVVAAVATAIWIGRIPARSTTSVASSEAPSVAAPPPGVVPSTVPRAGGAASGRRPVFARAPVAARVNGVEVLVPPDEAIALRRLLIRMRRTGLALPQSTVLVDEETGELLPAPPIEIPPITVDPLTPAGEGGSGRERR